MDELALSKERFFKILVSALQNLAYVRECCGELGWLDEVDKAGKFGDDLMRRYLATRLD